jgi:hypothetical protein
MQVSSLQSTPIGSGRTAAASAPQARLDGAPATAPTPRRAASPLHAGLATWQPELNGRVGRAQQARQYLEGLSGQLQSLKLGLSADLAGRPAIGPRVDDTLATLARTWQERPTASGGALDAQLRFSDAEPAARRFKVPGLDFASLQSGEREVLALSVATAGQRPMPVVIEPGLPAEALVQRLGQALAPAGVKALRDERGELVFAAAESQWAAVRDTLAIRGGGQRFPTGQFHRLRAAPEPDAVPVERWRADTVEDRKHSLHGVLAALDRVRGAQSAVTVSLGQAALALDGTRPTQGLEWAQAAAAGFVQAVSDTGFAGSHVLVAATDGLRRDRVMALLQDR